MESNGTVGDKPIVPFIFPMNEERVISKYTTAFDELNLLTSASYVSAMGKPDKVQLIIDDILSILIRAYTMGVEGSSDMLAYDLTVDTEKMREAIYEVIDGKTFEDRVAEYVVGGYLNSLENLVESEFHRVYNIGEYDGAVQFHEEVGYGVTRTWRTLKDDRVRETHAYMEGQEVALDEEFYTFDGDHAVRPGGFTRPENNVNCRCFVTEHYDGLQE